MVEEENDQFCTIIPDPLSAEAGMKAEWLGIDYIGLQAFKKQNIDVESEFAPCEAKIHHLRPTSILFDPVIRKLVNESNGSFLVGQRLTTSPGVQIEAMKLSRQYRSIICVCIENLQAAAKKPNQEHYGEYVAVFYDIGLIFHLCEILFVNDLRGDIVLPQLLEWIRFHYPETENAATKMLQGSLEPGIENRHSNYWDIITMLILQGYVSPARALLCLHSQADTEAFKSADKILHKLPVYSVFGGLSVSEFTSRWKNWQTPVLRALESGTFDQYTELKLIMRIVSGEIVPEMRQHCQTWYQLMVAILLYSEQTVKSFDLSYHANRCIKEFFDPKSLKLLDLTIIALLESDLYQVIKLLQQTCDSGWTAAHLTNLLYMCKRLNILDSKLFRSVAPNINEELLLDYGTLLMSHKSLWQAGITYLDHCPTDGQGRARIELLLPKVHFNTVAKTQKLIQIAVDRDMPHIACSICKIEGMKALKRHRIGQALNWALQSQDPGFATHLADILLKRYAKEGVFDSLDLLDNLGSCMLVSDRLICLAKYCEFQQFYQNGEFKKAASLLVSLLTSKISPKYFWLTLLSDALPLLERQDEPVFSYKDTCELMSCLEELTIEETDHPHASKSLMVERTKLIRLALTKNLKEALIHEASSAAVS